MTAQDQIVAYLEGRLDHFLAELTELSAIDSGSYDKKGVDRVQTWLASRLSALGFDVALLPQESFGDDLVATRAGTGAKRVLLLGHADTVYPKGTAAQRPLTIDDDTVLGPGTCDMKAGILAGIFAIEALDHIGWNGLDELTFVVVSDEEIGERHSIPLLEREGGRHDAILTLEAARENGDIVTSRKAGCQYGVEVTGKAAHAGVEPQKGRSATLALARIVDATFELNDLDAGRTVNPGEIRGGNAANVVAAEAYGHFDLRSWTTDDLEVLKQEFVEVATREWVAGATATATLIPDSSVPAMERTAGVIQLKDAAIELAAELGFAVAGAATGGGSDVSFAGRGGTPGLDGLGPVGGLDHGPDEYILRSSIVPRTALLASLIKRIGEDEDFSYAGRTD